MARSHRRRPRQERENVKPWVQVACAAALGGVVCLVALRPAPAARVVAGSGDDRYCIVIETVVSLMGDPFAPPLGASPEAVATIQALNAQLGGRRKDIMELPSVKRMGC